MGFSLNNMLEVAPATKSTPDPKPVYPHGAILDIQKSVALYERMIGIYDENQATTLYQTILVEDFRSILWEATKTPLPYTTLYVRQVIEGEVSFVHKSDLHWGRDISKAVSPKIRGGLEVKAVDNLKNKMDNAQVGDTVVWISAARDDSESEADCPYIDTQVNLIERVDEHVYQVRQFQRDREELSTNRSCKLFNRFVEQELLSDQTKIAELVTTVGIREGILETPEAMQLLAEVTGKSYTEKELADFADLEKRIFENSTHKAQKLLEFIKRGYREEELEEEFQRLLSETLGDGFTGSVQRVDGGMIIMTNCGAVKFGSRRVFSWNSSLISEYNKLGVCGGR